MSNLLLLYDTTEKDLARDFVDLLKEIELDDIKTISWSPDRGRTLYGKEKYYFDSADGMIFLITPGSVRDEKAFPSPSVNVEMGLATEKFRKNPERLIYLVEKGCSIPSIDQRCYIHFNREKIRSILGALTQLVRDLKQAGLFIKKTEHKETPDVDIHKLSDSIKDNIKQIICNDLAKKRRYVITENEFFSLGSKYGLETRDMNFVIDDLISNRLIEIKELNNKTYFRLTKIGWKLARYKVELEKNRQKEKEEEFKRLLPWLS